MNTPQALRRLRASLGGLTQEGLARRIDTLTVRSIARFESGGEPPPTSLAKIRLAALSTNDMELILYFQTEIARRLEMTDCVPQTAEQHAQVTALLRADRATKPARNGRRK